MRNLEEIYMEILGKPEYQNLQDLERAFKEKSLELEQSKKSLKVDISTIQKNGELLNAYHFLKVQWTAAKAKKSGLIYEESHRTQKIQSKNRRKTSKLVRLYLSLKAMVKVCALFILLSIFLQNFSSIFSKNLFSKNFYKKTDEHLNQMIKEEVNLREKINKETSKNRNTGFLNNSIDNREDLPLISHAKECNLSGVMQEVNSGNSINLVDSQGANIAHWFSRQNCSQGLKWAISQGVDIKKTDYSGRTPVEWARANNNIEVIKVFNKQFEGKSN